MKWGDIQTIAQFAHSFLSDTFSHYSVKVKATFSRATFSSSAVQPPLTQLTLNIGLPCETYSRVSPGKLFLSPFQAAYIEISRLGNSSLEQTPPYQGTHLYTLVKRSKRGTNFLIEKSDGPCYEISDGSCSEKSDGPGGIRTWDTSIPSPESYH